MIENNSNEQVKSLKKIGTRIEVMHGKALKTGGGLKKDDLTLNSHGHIVSVKASNAAKKNKNLEKTISNAKPAIFWKDREITKQQIVKLTPENIKQLIYKLSELELLIKKNINNSINLITDFILEQTLSYSNN